MYANGVRVKTGTATAGIDWGDPYRIGYASGPACNLVWTTCENAVFNKVLDPDAHALLYASTGL